MIHLYMVIYKEAGWTEKSTYIAMLLSMITMKIWSNVGNPGSSLYLRTSYLP